MQESQHKRLIDTLRGYGYHPFIGGDGNAYAVQSRFTGLDRQKRDIDLLLAENVPAREITRDDLPVYDQARLDALLAEKPHITNGRSFVFDRFTAGDDGMYLHAHLGYYFDMLATCDALDQEIQRHATTGSPTPLRDKLHALHDPTRYLRIGDGRSGVIGVAGLIVFPKDGEYVCIVGRRAASVATDPGRYHVLPAFVFQPSGPDDLIAGEWSLSRQIIREFGEEAFAMPEFADWPHPVTGADYFDAFPPVADLYAMLADGRAALELTGVVVSLLTLRPEVCSLILIQDEEWYPRWRDELAAAIDIERMETLYLPVLKGNDAFPDDLHLNGVPQGMAAFWLGVEQARKQLKGT